MNIEQEDVLPLKKAPLVELLEAIKDKVEDERLAQTLYWQSIIDGNPAYYEVNGIHYKIIAIKEPIPPEANRICIHIGE